MPCKIQLHWCARRFSRLHPHDGSKEAFATACCCSGSTRRFVCHSAMRSPLHISLGAAAIARCSKEMLTSAHSGFCCCFMSTSIGEMCTPSALISRRPPTCARHSPTCGGRASKSAAEKQNSGNRTRCALRTRWLRRSYCGTFGHYPLLCPESLSSLRVTLVDLDCQSTS